MRVRDPEAMRESARRYRERHPERVLEAQRRWRDAHPGWWQKYASEPGRVVQQAVWSATHREERAAKRRLRYAANPHPFREAARRYQTKRRDQFVERVDIELIALRDKFRCGVCQARVARKDWSLDHIEPVSSGGAHASWNVQLTHLLCNLRRGAGRLPAQLPLPLDLR